jgi:glyoxylase I family protein
MVLMVIGLDHVSILVADLTKATAFYEGVLQLKRLPRPDLGFDGAWLSLGAGQSLHLMCLPNPDMITGRVAHAGRDRHIALRVVQLEDIKAALTQANISFTHSQSGRNSIFCRDADGNGIEFLA